MSPVHRFRPLEVQLLEKISLGKVVFLVKTNTILHTNINFAHITYISHQMSLVHHLFPPNVQILETIF